MFDYKISKHPHFDEACRAFALRHNMAKLAERAGMNVQTLRNKLNPEQPHQLTAPEIWLLTDLTEDSTLVDGFLAQIHCLPCVPINEVAKEKLPHYVMSATAEIGRVAAGAVTAVRGRWPGALKELDYDACAGGSGGAGTRCAGLAVVAA
ncbi:phage regulatory CII family protein [Escherichia coli]|uniref:phage regulatory CII family protein n=1 Tax=Escherichia coli TaxID=562 RepID=UPI003D1619AE